MPAAILECRTERRLVKCITPTGFVPQNIEFKHGWNTKGYISFGLVHLSKKKMKPAMSCIHNLSTSAHMDTSGQVHGVHHVSLSSNAFKLGLLGLRNLGRRTGGKKLAKMGVVLPYMGIMCLITIRDIEAWKFEKQKNRPRSPFSSMCPLGNPLFLRNTLSSRRTSSTCLCRTR